MVSVETEERNRSLEGSQSQCSTVKHNVRTFDASRYIPCDKQSSPNRVALIYVRESDSLCYQLLQRMN